LLKPGLGFSWAWSQDGETVASIGVLVESDAVVLSYRIREHGGDWEPIE
jgi:hypothetical protein